jgi:hypothetical protein
VTADIPTISTRGTTVGFGHSDYLHLHQLDFQHHHYLHADGCRLSNGMSTWLLPPPAAEKLILSAPYRHVRSHSVSVVVNSNHLFKMLPNCGLVQRCRRRAPSANDCAGSNVTSAKDLK